MSIKKSVKCFYHRIIEKKSRNIIGSQHIISGNKSLVEQLLDSENYTMAFNVAMSYYVRCAPLFTAVNYITREISRLEPKLYDIHRKKFVDDHDMFDRLIKPNICQTWETFLEQLTLYYIITGNGYVLMRLDDKQGIIEMRVIDSSYVNIFPGTDCFPLEYHMYYFENNTVFRRDTDGMYGRFISADGKYELIHIKVLDPRYSKSRMQGIPLIMPLFLEIEQHLKGSIHNLSILERGITTTGILKMKTDVPQIQAENEIANMKMLNIGANNSGRPMIISQNMDYIPTAQTHKDMDYSVSQERVTQSIFNLLKVPLTMISQSAMTYNNLEIGKLNFYDNCILEMADKLFAEMSFAICRAYGLYPRRYKLTYDESCLSALEPRKKEQIKAIKESGVYTVNEIRRRTGELDDIPGGNSVYGAASTIPLLNADKDISDYDKINDDENIEYSRNILNSNLENSNDKDFVNNWAKSKKRKNVNKG